MLAEAEEALGLLPLHLEVLEVAVTEAVTELELLLLDTVVVVADQEHLLLHQLELRDQGLLVL
jgi:hypothetical protein